MDGLTLEQSDSDSGESWTLLENKSVYADDAPEFIEGKAKYETQHLEKDEDTDEISVISDSDHDTPSPPPPDHVFEECLLEKNLQSESVAPEYLPITSHLHNVNNNNEEPGSNDFLGDSHAKHKTYVHRRNKRLSTVLNIIVLGSVITAAGVAIGHMWGAKNDCTMQTTSSVNKILSNLYKLQEENAYLRSKLKELTFVNNKHSTQQKSQPKYNKCRKVFEESLSNNEPKKLTKCVDDNYNNVDNLMEHLVKPKFEKEFVADIDKLKTVYLQNKSWLDDEISRRLKIEEELLKKYKNEVNSAKDQKKDLVGQKDNVEPNNSDIKDSNERMLDNLPKIETSKTDYLHKKVTYADSLQTDDHPRFKREANKYTREQDNDWFTSEHNINNLNHIEQQELTCNENTNQNQNFETNDYKHDGNSYNIDILKSSEINNNNYKSQHTINDNWTEVKPKFRRNEERYETDHDKSFLEIKVKTNSRVKQELRDDQIKGKPEFSYEGQYTTLVNSETKNAQEYKKKGKKEKGDSKQSSESWKNYSNEDRITENFENEDVLKDNRYVINKLKQDKKKKGYVNSNKKQKRKIKHEKWNMKGDFGEKFEVPSPGEFVLNFSNNNMDNIEGVTGTYKDHKEKLEKNTAKEEKIDKITENTEQSANWFEKRAGFRTEARKKYYEQFSDSSPNNSSWYFRRMRKREQCRAKGDNSTLRKVYKQKKNKMH